MTGIVRTVTAMTKTLERALHGLDLTEELAREAERFADEEFNGGTATAAPGDRNEIEIIVEPNAAERTDR